MSASVCSLSFDLVFCVRLQQIPSGGFNVSIADASIWTAIFQWEVD